MRGQRAAAGEEEVSAKPTRPLARETPKEKEEALSKAKCGSQLCTSLQENFTFQAKSQESENALLHFIVFIWITEPPFQKKKKYIYI